MSWFYDTFLPSLLERAGTNKGMWLSRKQTAICIEKMEQHTTMVPQLQGDYCRHNYMGGRGRRWYGGTRAGRAGAHKKKELAEAEAMLAVYL